ncbi:MAG TPA: sensor domain-containing diguanylate cyclase, partial [Anaerolineales bacterium]
LIGTSVLSIIAPEERDQALDRFHQVKGTGSLLPAQQTLIREDGHRRIVELNLALVPSAGGRPRHYQSIGRDVTDITQENLRLKTSLANLSIQASTDALTGILNRGVILEHARAEWDRHQRENRPLSVMMIDMNGLKTINDEYGHAAGDAALLRIANVLRANKRQYDWLGRYGGDEFLLVLPGAGQQEADEVAGRIVTSLQDERMMLGGQPRPLSAGVGYSATDANGNRVMSVEQLIDMADQALYDSKRLAKARQSR